MSEADVYLRLQASYGVVGIATRYGLDGPGIESRWGLDFPTQSPVLWVPGLSRG